MLAERADARAQKDWAKADAMRDLLASAGVQVKGWREWFELERWLRVMCPAFVRKA